MRHRERRSAYPIESVGRALRLLTLVAERGSVSVSAAAEELGVARSTAHRMLATLLSEGFVRQDPVTKTYGPGRRMLEVGLAALRNLDVRAAARPELEALRDELGETVHLVLLEGTHILFVDSVESNRAVRVGSRTGMTMPAHCTAAGKVILAGLPPDALEEYLDALPAGLTPRSMEDPDGGPRGDPAGRRARLGDELRGERGRPVRRRRRDPRAVRHHAVVHHGVAARRAPAARAGAGDRRGDGPSRPGGRRTPASCAVGAVTGGRYPG